MNRYTTELCKKIDKYVIKLCAYIICCIIFPSIVFDEKLYINAIKVKKVTLQFFKIDKQTARVCFIAADLFRNVKYKLNVNFKYHHHQL